MARRCRAAAVFMGTMVGSITDADDDVAADVVVDVVTSRMWLSCCGCVTCRSVAVCCGVA